MAGSLDYAKDVVELFQQENTDYVLVMVQKTKTKDKAIVFYSARDKKVVQMLGETLHYLAEKVMHQPPQAAENVQIDETQIVK